MNKQEVFNFVVTHLFSQGQPSFAPSDYVPINTAFVITNDKHLCMYRGEAGRKCAVGCLIPDDVYKPEMENLALRCLLHGTTVGEIEYGKFADLPQVLHDHQDLLRALQNVHDRLENWRSEGDMRETLWNLYAPDIDKSILDTLHFPTK